MSILTLAGPLMSLIKAIGLKDIPGIVNASLTIVKAVADLLTPDQAAKLAAKHPSFTGYLASKPPTK
jgi:hypothetical protein